MRNEQLSNACTNQTFGQKPRLELCANLFFCDGKLRISFVSPGWEPPHLFKQIVHFGWLVSKKKELSKGILISFSFAFLSYPALSSPPGDKLSLESTNSPDYKGKLGP